MFLWTFCYGPPSVRTRLRNRGFPMTSSLSLVFRIVSLELKLLDPLLQHRISCRRGQLEVSTSMLEAGWREGHIIPASSAGADGASELTTKNHTSFSKYFLLLFRGITTFQWKNEWNHHENHGGTLHVVRYDWIINRRTRLGWVIRHWRY